MAFLSPVDNYHCIATGCRYRTTANSAEGADAQLAADGGSDSGKRTKCPKCHKNALLFLYPTNL